MALETRMVEVPFSGGIDTKTDEKLVLSTRLTKLENGVFTKRGKVKKRNGYVALGNGIVGGAAIASGDALGVFQDELILFDRSDLYSYSSGIDAWIDKGDVVPVVINQKQVIRNSYQQLVSDAAEVSGVRLHAWEDGRGGIRATATDTVSGVPLMSDVQVASLGIAPRVLALGQKIIIVYKWLDGGTDRLSFRFYNPQIPLTLEAEANVAADVHPTNPYFDVVRHGTKLFFAYNTSGGNIKIGYLTENGDVGTALLGLPAVQVLESPAHNFVPGDVTAGTDTITITGGHGLTGNMVLQFTTDTTLPAGLSLATDYYVIRIDADDFKVSLTLGGGAVDITDGGTGIHTATPQAQPADNSIAVVVEAVTEDIYVAWHGDKNGLRCAVLRADFSLLLPPTEIDSALTPLRVNLTGAIISAGAACRFFYEETATNDYDHLVRMATITSAGVLTAPIILKRSVGLASKAFLYNSIVWVNVAHDSTLQATYFLLSDTGFIAGRESPTVAGGLVLSPSLPQVFSGGAGLFVWSSLIKTKLVSEGNTVFTLRGVAETALDFISTKRFFSAELGENLHITGGYLTSYDGHSAVEHGFHLFPENDSAVVSNTGGSMADGTYQYSIVFEWTDSKGQVHRSAPSIAQTVVVNSFEQSTVQCIADSGGDLNDQFFLLSAGNDSVLYYVWYNINAAGTDPALTGKVGIEVTAATNATANDIAAATQSAIDAFADFTTSVATDTVTITNVDSGAATDVVDGSATTGFTFNVLVQGEGGTSSVALTIPSLRLTAKTSPRAEVVLSVYRTLNNGSVFQKVTSIISPAFNDPTADTVVVTDTISDITLLSNEFLYTTGGVFGNISPPACSLIAADKNRVVVGGLEDGNLLWYSKPRVAGEGVGFSDIFTVRIDAGKGPITALAIMDGKVIVFKKAQIFVFAGDGPNEAGGGEGFTPDESITTDVGCDSPNSIAPTPDGIVFKSAKGRYLLDRTLRVDYIGANVEGFNDLNDTSADLVDDTNQVRFVTSDGVALMYDYQIGEWGTFTNHQAVDAAVWNSDYVYLKADGEVMRETAAHFKDGNVRFNLTLTTAWIKFAGVQGFQRVRRALILGEFKSEHILTVGVGINYENSFPEQFSFDTGAILDSSVYGDDTYYGEDTVYGGVEDTVYQFEKHLQRQKCQAMRFEISDLFSGESGEAFEISSLGLLIGVKKGAFRPRLEKRA